MGSVPACDVCGKTPTKGLLPPDVEPCRWSNATENYNLVLCHGCMGLPLPEILAHAVSGPGGVVQGADRGPYLVVPENG